MILAPWRISKVCIWIDEQRLLECRFADQEILHARNHLVPCILTVLKDSSSMAR